MIKTKVRKVNGLRLKMRKKQMIPITRNCASCVSNDDVMGCRLKGQLSPAGCVAAGFSYYKKGKQLFFCERCETCSVTSHVAGFMQVPSEPRIVFWCQNCDDFPIIEGEVYRGYHVEGMTFLKRRNSFLDRNDDKGEIFR